jgi:hypothetical protein
MAAVLEEGKHPLTGHESLHYALVKEDMEMFPYLALQNLHAGSLDCRHLQVECFGPKRFRLPLAVVLSASSDIAHLICERPFVLVHPKGGTHEQSSSLGIHVDLHQIV